MQLNPVDQYNNPVTTYGLSMKATVIYAATDIYTFYSTFNVDSVNPEEAYTIEIVFPRDTSAGGGYEVRVEVDLPVRFFITFFLTFPPFRVASLAFWTHFSVDLVPAHARRRPIWQHDVRRPGGFSSVPAKL